MCVGKHRLVRMRFSVRHFGACCAVTHLSVMIGQKAFEKGFSRRHGYCQVCSLNCLGVLYWL